MGPLGVPELIIIFCGGSAGIRAAKAARTGEISRQGLSEFRRASNELRNTLEEEVRAAEYELPHPHPSWKSR